MAADMLLRLPRLERDWEGFSLSDPNDIEGLGDDLSGACLPVSDLDPLAALLLVVKASLRSNRAIMQSFQAQCAGGNPVDKTTAFDK